MDPFSVAAGGVGILAALEQAQRCIRWLRCLKDAPDEVRDTLEQLSAIHAVLTNFIKVSYQSKNTSERQNSPISMEDSRSTTIDQLTAHTARRLNQLGKLVPQWNDSTATQDPADADGVESSCCTSKKTGLSLRRRDVLKWSRHRYQAQNLMDKLQVELSLIINLLILSQILPYHKAPSCVAQSRSDLSTYTSQRKLFPTGFTHVHQAMLCQERLGQKPSSRSLDVVRPASEYKEERDGATKRTRCKPWCSCECHSSSKTWNIQIPFASGPPVALYISWRSATSSSKQCSERQCVRFGRSGTYFQLNLRASGWLARHIQLAMRIDPFYGPEMNVRLPRVRNWNSQIWNYAISGDLSAIRRLFINGEASPSDVNPHGGNLLHYAAVRHSFPLFTYALSVGASITETDDWGANPLAKIWENYLTNHIDGESWLKIGPLVDEYEYSDTRNFSDIHKILLGLALKGPTLEQALSLSTKNIDTPDAEGKTPLHWATIKSDPQAMETLLSFGASQDIEDGLRRSPLFYAESTSCAKLLLDKGADKDATDSYGCTALGSICGGGREKSEIVRFLLENGAASSTREDNGQTPLVRAYLCGYRSCVEQLLRWQGATEGGEDLSSQLLGAIGSKSWHEANSIVLEILAGSRSCADVKQVLDSWPDVLERRRRR